MSLNRNVKISVSSYIGGNRFKRFVAFFYFAFTKYNQKSHEGVNSNISKVLFFNSHEKVYRNDHALIFNKLFNRLSELDNSFKLEFKRGFNFSALGVFKNLIESKGNILNLLEIQFGKTISGISFENIDFIIVFCDSNPLQSYIVNFAKSKGIKTMGLQHGFYPEINNSYWRRIYLASNSDYFAAWDEKTISILNMYSLSNRKYLKVGPINVHKKKTNLNKSIKINNVAIYSVGKDQDMINDYLVSFYKYLKMNTNLKLKFICHPRFNLFDRLLFSIKNKILFRNNLIKNRSYDFHFILNSSVWLELESNNESYLRLDDFYSKGINFQEILESMHSYKEVNNVNSNNLRKPFKTSEESLNVIIDFINNKKYYDI